nr:hypothetical protein 14 [Saccharospirillaceae bacterium]
MSFKLDFSGLQAAEGFLDAFDEEIQTASVASANSTATWLRRVMSEHIAGLGPKKKLIRAMSSIERARNGRPESRVRPGARRLFASSFNSVRSQRTSPNPTRADAYVTGFQRERKATGFINPRARSGNPRVLRRGREPGDVRSGLGPSPAELYAEYFQQHPDFGDEIQDQLILFFEDHLSKAMNNR